MNKKLLINLSKYALGVGAMVYIVWKYWDPPTGVGFKAALQNPIQMFPLAMATAVSLAAILVTFVRWYVLVRAQNLPFTPFNAVRLGLIGFFFSVFLPGGIGGDVVKAAFIAREQDRRTVAVATVLLDRAIGLWGIIWMVALVGIAFWLQGNEILAGSPELQWMVRTAVLIVAGTVSGWYLIGFLPARRADRFAGRLARIPRIGLMAAEFWRAIWMYRCRSLSVILALALSLVSMVGFVLAFYFAAQVFFDSSNAVGIPSMHMHFLIVPVGKGVEALFPAPGGMGGGEASFAGLYMLIDKAMESRGSLACFTQRVINWSLAIVGYLVYLQMRSVLKAPREEAAENADDKVSASDHSPDAQLVG